MAFFGEYIVLTLLFIKSQDEFNKKISRQKFHLPGDNYTVSEKLIFSSWLVYLCSHTFVPVITPFRIFFGHSKQFFCFFGELFRQ